MELSFIIIDDSELDCFIAKKMIERVVETPRITTFLAATEALDKITANTFKTDGSTAIIILDIMMPVMNGFRFIELFETLAADVQEKYFIITLISSRNRIDHARLENYKTVKMILEKPITADKIQSIIAKAKPGFDQYKADPF